MINMFINNGFKQTGSGYKSNFAANVVFGVFFFYKLNWDNVYKCCKNTLNLSWFSITRGTIIKMSTVVQSGHEVQNGANEGISIPFLLI